MANEKFQQLLNKVMNTKSAAHPTDNDDDGSAGSPPEGELKKEKDKKNKDEYGDSAISEEQNPENAPKSEKGNIPDSNENQDQGSDLTPPESESHPTTKELKQADLQAYRQASDKVANAVDQLKTLLEKESAEDEEQKEEDTSEGSESEEEDQNEPPVPPKEDEDEEDGSEEMANELDEKNAGYEAGKGVATLLAAREQQQKQASMKKFAENVRKRAAVDADLYCDYLDALANEKQWKRAKEAGVVPPVGGGTPPATGMPAGAPSGGVPPVEGGEGEEEGVVGPEALAQMIKDIKENGPSTPEEEQLMEILTEAGLLSADEGKEEAPSEQGGEKPKELDESTKEDEISEETKAAKQLAKILDEIDEI